MMIPDDLLVQLKTIRKSYQSLLDDIANEVDSMIRKKVLFKDVHFMFNSSIDEVRNNPITKTFFTYLRLKYSNIPAIDLEYIVVKSLKEYAEEMFTNMRDC